MQATSHLASCSWTHGERRTRLRSRRRCRISAVHANADRSDTGSCHAGVKLAITVGGEPWVPGRELRSCDIVVGFQARTQVGYIESQRKIYFIQDFPRALCNRRLTFVVVPIYRCKATTAGCSAGNNGRGIDRLTVIRSIRSYIYVSICFILTVSGKDIPVELVCLMQ